MGSRCSWQHVGSRVDQDSHLSRDASANGIRISARRKQDPERPRRAWTMDRKSCPIFCCLKNYSVLCLSLQVWRKFSLITMLGQDDIQGSQTKVGPRDCPCVGSGSRVLFPLFT